MMEDTSNLSELYLIKQFLSDTLDAERLSEFAENERRIAITRINELISKHQTSYEENAYVEKDNNDFGYVDMHLFNPGRDSRTNDNAYPTAHSYVNSQTESSKQNDPESCNIYANCDSESDEVEEIEEDKIFRCLTDIKNTSSTNARKKSVYSGYLEKRRRMLLMNRWEKIYCVIKSSVMLWYKTEHDNTSLGVIVLVGYDTVFEASGKNSFSLIPNAMSGRFRPSYHFRCNDDVEKWHAALKVPYLKHKKLARNVSKAFLDAAEVFDKQNEGSEDLSEEIYDEVLDRPAEILQPEYENHSKFGKNYERRKQSREAAESGMNSNGSQPNKLISRSPRPLPRPDRKVNTT